MAFWKNTKTFEIIESKLEDTQCGFRPGRSNTDQIFILHQIFESSWQYAKTSTLVSSTSTKYMTGSPEKLWGVLREYSVDEALLLGAKSLYTCLQRCVCGSFQKPQSCQFLNRSLFRSSPMVMNLGNDQKRWDFCEEFTP